MPQLPNDYRKTFAHLCYPSEKFSYAVYILAVGPGDVRSRLKTAYLEFHPVQKSLLPDEFQADYDWICNKLTGKAARYEWEDCLEASLASMRNSTGSKIAKRIYELHDNIESMIQEDQRKRGRMIVPDILMSRK